MTNVVVGFGVNGFASDVSLKDQPQVTDVDSRFLFTKELSNGTQQRSIKDCFFGSHRPLRNSILTIMWIR